MNKKELKKKYAQTIQPMGVFQVKNLANGKIFIDSGLNMNGKMNRCKFQLGNGSHMNKSLQADYDKSDEENFEYSVLDFLEPREAPDADYAEELKMLEAMWIEKLQPFAERGYNKEKSKKGRI